VEVYLNAFLTWALHGGGQLSRRGRFTHGEKSPRYSLHSRLGGPQSRSGLSGEGKEIPSMPLPRIEPRSSSLQPSLYTDSAIPNPQVYKSPPLIITL